MFHQSGTNDANAGAGAAIADFLQAIDDGMPLNVDAWLAKYPQYETTLREFLASEGELLSLVGKSKPASSTDNPLSDRDRPQNTFGNASTPRDFPEDRIVLEAAIQGGFEHYQIGELIGQGGMGAVYQATDKRLNRQVAIKVMRSGVFADQRERRRFRREAEAVAQLEHPNIVPIYEVSEMAGEAFFVMKLLKPLQASSQPGLRRGFQDKEAAERMIPICTAIHFAHQRGILHRDLKPANILQDDSGTPYVVDFGLAKKIEITDGSTIEGGLVGTPAFVAPEQLYGEATIQSDVYGLGAILYWMLTGSSPHVAKNLPDLLASFQRLQPLAPRSVCPAIDRNLEIVCLKCLSSDPKHRYQSAQAVGDDLRRWLAHEPILAKPTSLLERIGKYCQRKPAIAALVSILIVSVLISLSVFSMQYQQIANSNRDLEKLNLQLLSTVEQERHSRSRAESNERISDSVRKLLIESFRSADPTVDGRDVKVADQLIAAKDKIRADESLDSMTRGAALEAIGSTLASLGLIGEAKQAMIESESSFADVLDETSLRLLATRGELGHLHYLAGDPQKSMDVLQSVVDGYESIGETETMLHHRAINYLSLALTASGKANRAIEYLVPVYDFQKKNLEANAEPFLMTVNNLGHAMQAAGNVAEALGYALEALAGQQVRFGANDPRTMTTQSNVAVVYLMLNQPKQALPLLEQVLTYRKAVLGEHHYETLVAENNLAGVYMNSGERQKAVETLAGLLPRMEAQLGNKHPTTLGVRYNLGGGYMATGKHREAADIFSAYAEEMAKTGGPTHPSTLKARANLAICLEQLDDYIAARDIYQDLIELERPDANRTEALAMHLESLGRVLNQLEEYPAAEAVLREATTLRWKMGDTSWRSVVTKSLLGESLLGQQQIDEASVLLVESSETLQTMQEEIPILNRESILALARNRLERLQRAQSVKSEGK